MKYVFILLWFFAFSASAHNLGLGKADVRIATNGTITASVDFDLTAWAVGVEAAKLHAEHIRLLAAMAPKDLEAVLESARRRLENESALAPAVNFKFDFPTETQFRRALQLSQAQSIMPSNFTIAAAARLPAGEHAIRVQFPPLIGAVVLTIHTPNGGVAQELLLPGEKSSPCTVRAGAGAEATRRSRGVARYVMLGFTHILPKGCDHILFVLGLFFLSPQLKPLLWQVTAFTLAHSLTLGLSLYGVFSLSPRLVEPLIAASITFVAIENLFTSRLHPWRPFVVFGFGLIHGLGFAGVLTEFGLPRRDFVPALISFNLGVEFGQLAVLSLATLIVGWFFRKAWYRAAVVIPASCAIGMVGVYWTIERILG